MGSRALAQGRQRRKAFLWERDPTRRPKPSTRQPKVEGSSLEEESTPPPGMEPTTQEAEEKVRQGVWGDTTTTVLPEAYELLEEDPEADSTPGRVDPQPTNEELVDKVKTYDEVYFIKRSKEYRHLREGKARSRGYLAHQAPSRAKACWSTWWVLSRPLSQRPHHRLQALAHVLSHEEQR